MNKLYFKYGTMNSSKSAHLLMIKHNYEEQHMNVLLLKPSIDTRDGSDIVKSRIGLESKCQLVSPDKDIKLMDWGKYDVIMVDEAQFLTEEQVNQLYLISCEIPVICFGLLTDFQQKLFPGSKRLIELAESLEKFKTVCSCGEAANYNARFDENGKFICNGDQIQVGGNESYKAVCKKCYEKLKRYGTINSLDKYF